MTVLKYSKKPLLILLLPLVFGCASWRTQKAENGEDTTEDSALGKTQPTDKEKIEHLSQALSRSQMRIEELEAKMNILQESFDRSKMALDNIAGTKDVPVQPLGSNGDGVKAEPTVSENAVPPTESISASAPTEDQAIQDFKRAMGLYKKKAFSDAVIEFNKFAEKYSEHVLAGSAQYHVGESYYNMGEYKFALNEYEKVIKNFADGPRVPSALVRIAHCLVQLGKPEEAKRFLHLAQENYPGNPSLDWPVPEARLRLNAPETIKKAQEPKEKDADLPVEPMSPPETSFLNLNKELPC